MVQIVTRIYSAHVIDRFFPALLVQAELLSLRRRDALDERKIRAANGGEHGERVRGVDAFVLHDLRPLLLIERLNLGAIAAQDHPQAVREHDFSVRKVRDDLRDRPLARRRTAGQQPARRSLRRGDAASRAWPPVSSAGPCPAASPSMRAVYSCAVSPTKSSPGKLVVQSTARKEISAPVSIDR